MKKGYYIVLESGEGLGKTTQLTGIKEFLDEYEIPNIITKEPGGTEVGKEIRNVLLNPYLEEPLPLTKLLLYSADRLEHIQRVILPNIKKGISIIGDRSHISTRVYQKMEGISIKRINQLEKIIDVFPVDLAFIIDGDPEQGLRNAEINSTEFGELDNFERKTLNFHKRLRESYLEEIKKNPGRYIKIDYIHNNPRKMQEEIRFYLKKKLKI
jgi:dTMP kinase